MSRDFILGAIRRGLRRGPLREDQAMALRARMAAHPRHLIPARSQVPRPEQIALFIRNIEKEFGSVARVPDFAAIPFTKRTIPYWPRVPDPWATNS